MTKPRNLLVYRLINLNLVKLFYRNLHVYDKKKLINQLSPLLNTEFCRNMLEKKLLNQFAPLFKNSFKNQELKHIQFTEYCIYTKSQSTLRYTEKIRTSTHLRNVRLIHKTPKMNFNTIYFRHTHTSTNKRGDHNKIVKIFK